MESPASWKTAELVISETLYHHHQSMRAGVVGCSAQHLIAEALREAGLLNDADEPEVGWGPRPATRQVDQKLYDLQSYYARRGENNDPRREGQDARSVEEREGQQARPPRDLPADTSSQDNDAKGQD